MYYFVKVMHPLSESPWYAFCGIPSFLWDSLEWHSSALGPGWFNDSSNFGCIVRWCFCARIKAVANCFFCIFPNEPCCKPPLHVERREVVIRTCISQRKLARKQNTGIPTRKQSLWPRKWSRSGGVSNSLRPCEMKDLSSTAQMM